MQAGCFPGFFSFLGFTRLLSDTPIRKAIVEGIKDGTFGYFVGSTPSLGPDGRFQVSLAKVRFDTSVAEDEIDLDSGFLMLPQAMPQPVPAGASAGPTVPGLSPSEVYPSGPEFSPAPAKETTSGSAPSAGDKVVELSFTANRDQLFTAWNALANLADLTGKVQVSVRAESEKPLDRSKLQNGVLEPLREADLIR